MAQAKIKRTRSTGFVKEPQERLSSGIEGLDEVLDGGFLPRRTYLVRGGPGSGKTTLGLHFLRNGAQHGEKVLYITLGEAEEKIRQDASSIGCDTAGIDFLDLSPDPAFFTEAKSYDVFSAADVEREPLTRQILEAIDALGPQRIFLDAMTQFRYLSSDLFQFRKQVLSFLGYLSSKGATVLFSSEGSAHEPDDDLQFLADGVLTIEANEGERNLSIGKFRGSGFRSGRHAMRISGAGVEIFPRLMPETYKRKYLHEQIASGVPELDSLLHGGLERGTITIMSGPTGTGKTTIGLQFMKEAAGRGERSVIYSFEEEPDLILSRCDSINIPARAMIENGTLSLVKVEPLRYTPEEFARMVRREVEEHDARIVMIDSVAGYRLSLGGNEELVTHLHSLSKYMQNMGVAVLLINELEKVIGDFKATENRISYLADNILFLRYVEHRVEATGLMELRKAIGVLKKRLSSFEKDLRELEISRYGIKVSPPLKGLNSILGALPEWKEP